jgi:hypothetical protein
MNTTIFFGSRILMILSVKQRILDIREHLASTSGKFLLVLGDAKLKVAFFTP